MKKQLFLFFIFSIIVITTISICLMGCSQHELEVCSLEISPTPEGIGINQTWQFSIDAYDCNGAKVWPSATWSVVGEIGTISSDGLFSAGANTGEGYVVATFGTKTASTEVRVIDWGWLAGRTRSASTLLDISGITVYLKERSDLLTISSDHPSGYVSCNFIIPNIPPGTYEARTEETNTYEAASQIVTIEAGKYEYTYFDLELKP